MRLKVLPVDYDQDGHLDLLVGDMFADCPQNDYTGFVWFYRGKPDAKKAALPEPSALSNFDFGVALDRRMLDTVGTQGGSQWKRNILYA